VGDPEFALNFLLGELHMDTVERCFLVAAGLFWVLVGRMAWFELM
jgi:hypothetical protein